MDHTETFVPCVIAVDNGTGGRAKKGLFYRCKVNLHVAYSNRQPFAGC
jgi:hypothetical protein